MTIFTKAVAYIIVFIVNGFRSIDSILFSSNRLSKGIRDITSLAKIIELKSVEYAESFKDYVVLPTQLRSKSFKVSRRNLLAENPIAWHCFYCSDTNRQNDRIDIFNKFNYTELPLTFPVDNYDRLCQSFLPPPSYQSPKSLRQENISTAKSLSHSFVVFDFGSAVFDLKEEYEQEVLNSTESPVDLQSGTLRDLERNLTTSETVCKTTEVAPMLLSSVPLNTESINMEPSQNIDSLPIISPDCSCIPNVQEPSQDTPDIRKNTETEKEAKDNKEKNEQRENTTPPLEEVESDSEIVLSHFPIAVLFFLIGLIFAYSVDAARSSLRDYLADRERKYVDYLIQTVIELLEAEKFTAAVKQLKGGMPRVVRFRGEGHVDTAALHHYLAKAYIGLKDGVAAEKSLEEAKKIYEPFGGDIYMAQVLEDLSIALKLQNRLEESKLKMFMALKIFNEEETMEESSSSSSSYSFSSSISTASNYSIDSNSVGEEMSSGSSCCSMDNSHIDQFIRHDYSSKRREIEIARLNVMTQTSNQSTPTMSLPLPVPTPSPPSATGTTTSMFSPPSSYHRNGQSHDWNGSNMDDIHPFHAGDPDHLLHYEVTDGPNGKYYIDSDNDFWNEVENLEDMLRPSSSIGSTVLNENQLHSMHRVGVDENPSSFRGMLNSASQHSNTHALRSSADEEGNRKKKLARTRKDVARVERSIASLFEEGGELEKAQVYYQHSKR
eukprot:gene24261-32694_t